MHIEIVFIFLYLFNIKAIMIDIVFYSGDVTSANAGHHALKCLGATSTDSGSFSKGEIEIRRSDCDLLHSEYLDELGADLIIFLSKHSSSSGTPAFTVHSTGNWSKNAEFGGKPKSLSTAAPYAMLNIIKRLSKLEINGIEKTYEATHHGPLLNTPSLFLECGGNKEALSNVAFAEKLGEIALEASEDVIGAVEYRGKVVIGIGGGHYPSKFTKLAVEKGYAFSHILPKYAISGADGAYNIDMLEQAVVKSHTRAECAVIDWKSVNSKERAMIIKKLDEIGIAYEKA